VSHPLDVQEIEQLRAEALRLRREHELLRATLGDVLAQFTQHGHPGQPCLRTMWIGAETVASWRALHASIAEKVSTDG